MGFLAKFEARRASESVLRVPGQSSGCALTARNPAAFSPSPVSVARQRRQETDPCLKELQWDCDGNPRLPSSAISPRQIFLSIETRLILNDRKASKAFVVAKQSYAEHVDCCSIFPFEGSLCFQDKSRTSIKKMHLHGGENIGWIFQQEHYFVSSPTSFLSSCELSSSRSRRSVVSSALQQSRWNISR